MLDIPKLYIAYSYKMNQQILRPKLNQLFMCPKMFRNLKIIYYRTELKAFYYLPALSLNIPSPHYVEYQAPDINS